MSVSRLLSPLRRLYDMMLDLAADPKAMYWLALVAFAESSFFPIPQDVMMIPMIIAAREKAFQIALVATIASVAGGVLGYGIGALFFDQLGVPILEFYGAGDKFDMFQAFYEEWGVWIVAAGSFTPIPYKVTTIASGLADMNLWAFMAVSFTGRGLRFFLLAGLLWYFGPAIRRMLEKHFGLVSALFFIILIGGFVAVKFLI